MNRFVTGLQLGLHHALVQGVLFGGTLGTAVGLWEILHTGTVQRGLYRIAAAIVLGSMWRWSGITAITAASITCLHAYVRGRGLGWLAMVMALAVWPLGAVVDATKPLAAAWNMTLQPSWPRLLVWVLLDYRLAWLWGLGGVTLLFRRCVQPAPFRWVGPVRPKLALGLALPAMAAWGALRVDAWLRPALGPEVILIAIDTLRADHLSSWGYNHETDPGLHALTRDAVVYEQAVSPAPWTVPALMSAHTGLYPGRLKIRDVPIPMPATVTTIAELLREHNYRTHAAVSNLYGSSAVGFDRGFDSFDERSVGGAEVISSEQISDRALEVLAGRGSGPLFLYLHYFDPHRGYARHDPWYWDLGYHGDIVPLMGIEDLRDRRPWWGPADLQQLRSLYDSEIGYTDHHIERVLQRLKAQGRYRDALIIVFADHGEEFSERGDQHIGHATTLWQELVHVPLIVKYPGNEGAGRRVSRPVSLVDIAPTIAKYADIAMPQAIDGRPLDLRPPEDRALLSETWRTVALQAVRLGHEKLIVDRSSGRTRLFDLREDPLERVDLAERRPDRVTLLKRRLDEWDEQFDYLNAADSAVFLPAQEEQLRTLGYLE